MVLDWADKKAKIALAGIPPCGTPVIVERTGAQAPSKLHRYFEMDNIDGLKYLLLSTDIRFQLIYIDPPYNTEHVRLFSSFSEDNRCIDNSRLPSADEHTAAHERWAGELLPRLTLARRLMQNDGVIIISMDDTELAVLRLLCDEVFGQDNFLECIVWERATEMVSGGRNILHNHDYNLIYAKNAQYLFQNEHGAFPVHTTLWRAEQAGTVLEERLRLAQKFNGACMFKYPKPVKLLVKLFSLYGTPSGSVLDFYSGSGSAAEAVLLMNAQDGGNRTITLMQDTAPLGNVHPMFPQIQTVPQFAWTRIRRDMAMLSDGKDAFYRYTLSD